VSPDNRRRYHVGQWMRGDPRHPSRRLTHRASLSGPTTTHPSTAAAKGTGRRSTTTRTGAVAVPAPVTAPLDGTLTGELASTNYLAGRHLKTGGKWLRSQACCDTGR